jgi:hypothetical protein
MSINFVVGTRTLLELVSQTHGAVRVPLAQNFDYTPAFEERRIFEFDTADAVAIVTNFNGVDVAFNHYDSDSKLVDAMINDLDPAGTAIADDPSQYKGVTILLNVRSKDTNKIFQSILVKNVNLTGAAASEPVREEAQIARSGTGTNVLRIKGAAIEYNRALRAASTAFAQGVANSHADVVATLNVDVYEFDVTNTPQVVSAASPDLDGESLIYVLKNGSVYTGATITIKTVSIPAVDFGANDVFEVYTTYIDS